MDRETNLFIKEELGTGNVYEVEIADCQNGLIVTSHKKEMKFSVDMDRLYLNENVTNIDGSKVINRLREIFGEDAKFIAYGNYYNPPMEGAYNFKVLTDIYNMKHVIHEYSASYIVVSKKRIKEGLIALFPDQTNSDTQIQY